MRSNGIQKAVRATQYNRAAGDAPAIGRVGRTKGTGIPKSSRRRRTERGRSRKKDDRRRFIRIWSILLGFFALAAILSVVYLWILPKIRENELAAKPRTKKQESARVVSKFQSPPQNEALDLVKRALMAREPDQIAGCFRLGDSTPQEAVQFLQESESSWGVPVKYNWMSSIDANGLSMDGVLVMFKKGVEKDDRLALLVADATGRWKIDFAAYACKSKPSWNEIIEKDSELAHVRVIVARDKYYNGPFVDETQWTCYGMAAPKHDEILFGYCKVGSPQEAAMKWALSKDKKKIRMTLEIQKVPAAGKRQYQISKVIAEDWAVGDMAFDKTFSQ